MQEAAALPTPDRVGLAVLLVLAATAALPLGAALGVYLRPPQRLVAAVMAFGSGALIEALAVDLALEGANRLVRDHQLGAIAAWAYVAAGFVLGGLAFYVANRQLEPHGAHLRKRSLVAAYVDRHRHLWRDTLHRLHLDQLSRLVDHGPGHVRRAETHAMAPVLAEHHGSGAAMAIFLGALLDGIPESVVIGASFVGLAAFNPSFVIAVFLNNLPEAMSSASGMLQSGFARRRIFLMWGGLMAASAVAAAAGNVLLVGADPTLLVFVNALGGGGILAMLAATMMPEAFEEGGPSVGLATIAGFLAAFLFTTLSLAT
jgi:ZIP family zinc transporter